VSWLKKLFGTTDAIEDALERAPEDEASVRPTTTTETTTSRLPAGWASPTTRDEGDTIVLEMPAPGLDPHTLAVEPEGSKLHLRASGKSADGHQMISLDEALDFPEGSDLSGATADYADDRLVVRIPKAGLKGTQSSA
jgi:HSP20 family molecular chaperone IbpA